MPKNTPLDPWGQATNARYACVVIKRASAGRFGPKSGLPSSVLRHVDGRAAAVEVPNPTKQALTDGATVDFDEPGVKKRPTCTQQPTVPNTGGARGHLGSRRAKTRMGRHLARRPAWRSVDGPVEYVFRSGKKTRRRVGYPPNLIKLLGRPHPTSVGGGDGAVGGGLGGRFVPLPRKGDIFCSQCFPGSSSSSSFFFFFRSRRPSRPSRRSPETSVLTRKA